jgi:hypothetical protein
MGLSEQEMYFLDLINERFDRLDARVDARADSIVKQMQEINGRVTSAHVTLGAHSVLLKTVSERAERAAANAHKAINLVQAHQPVPVAEPADARKITMRDFWIVSGTVGTLAAAAKFFHLF